MAIVLRGLAAFAAVIALGAASIFGYYWWQDRPTNQSLEESAMAFDEIVELLENAETLEDVADAGDAAGPAAQSVESSLQSLDDEPGPFARAAREVLRAQGDLLSAISLLADLGSEDLLVWGAAQPEVDDAVDNLAQAREALERANSGSTDLVPDPTAALETVTQTAGRAGEAILLSEFEDIIGELTEVSDTSGASVVGAQAARMAEASQSIRSGQQGQVAERLIALTAGFGAVAALDGMTPTTLAAWSGADQQLLDAATKLDVEAAQSTRSMNEWIDRAGAQVEQWENEVAAIRSQRALSIADLDGYSTQVRSLMKQYNRARQATSDALEDAALDDFDSYTVEFEMEDGVRERRRIASSLARQVPPDSMQAAHLELVSVIEDAASAMATGEQAVEDFNYCYVDCPPTYRDTAGWQSFSAASAELTSRFAAAESGWETSLGAALNAAGARKLPPIPEV